VSNLLNFEKWFLGRRGNDTTSTLFGETSWPRPNRQPMSTEAAGAAAFIMEEHPFLLVLSIKSRKRLVSQNHSFIYALNFAVWQARRLSPSCIYDHS
jgi:hypothetical protein